MDFEEAQNYNELIQDLEQLVEEHKQLYLLLPFQIEEIRPRSIENLISQSGRMTDQEFNFLASEQLDQRCYLSDLEISKMKDTYDSLQGIIDKQILVYNQLRSDVVRHLHLLQNELPCKVDQGRKSLDNMVHQVLVQCDFTQNRETTPTNRDPEVIDYLIQSGCNTTKQGRKQLIKQGKDAIMERDHSDEEGGVHDSTQDDLDEQAI